MIEKHKKPRAFRMTDELYGLLKAEAKKRHTTASSVLTQALYKFLNDSN